MLMQKLQGDRPVAFMATPCLSMDSFGEGHIALHYSTTNVLAILSSSVLCLICVFCVVQETSWPTIWREGCVRTSQVRGW
jgi:hypothetical protein